MKTKKKTTSLEVIRAMRVLGMTGDKVFAMIEDALRREQRTEARGVLNFVDVLVEAAK